MSEWKEQSAKRRLVQRSQRGEDLEPKQLNRKRTGGVSLWWPWPWLHEGAHLMVWGRYKTEEIAKQALRGKGRSVAQYYCHRDVYEKMKPFWKSG